MSLSTELRNSRYMYFIPEYLREDENFLVFFSFLVHEFDITEDNIMNFTDLVNPDKVPMEFIEALGSYFNYHYLPNATDDFNREVLTRMRTIWEQRGTEKSILMAAIHGDNDGWVGGDIFIPGYDISNQSAELLIPSKWVFTHNKSSFSGLHKFPSGDLYTPGILYLRLPYIDEQIRKRVYENTPAGLKYVFELLFDFTPNKNLPDIYKDAYGNLSLYNFFRVWPKDSEERKKFDNDIDVLLDIAMSIRNDWMKYAQVFSQTRGYFSGWRNYYNFPVLEDEINTILGVSMLGLPILKAPFPIENGTKTVAGVEDIAFKHNKSEFNSGKFVNSSMVVDRQEADDSKYLISGSGEYLDIWNRGTVDHILHRSIDLSIGEFFIYDEDPSLGVVPFSWQRERHVLSDDSTYDIPYIGNLTADDYVLRDNFWNSDVEINEEIIKRSGTRDTEIIPNKNATSIDKGKYGELSMYSIFRLFPLYQNDANAGYYRFIDISSNKENKELVHSGNNDYGMWSGNILYVSMSDNLKTWNREGLKNKNNDLDVDVERSIIVRNDLNHPLIFSGSNKIGRYSGSLVGISKNESYVMMDVESERDDFSPNKNLSDKDIGTYGTLSFFSSLNVVEDLVIDTTEDRITELVVPEGRNNQAIFGSNTMNMGRHSGMLVSDNNYSYPSLEHYGERSKEISEFIDGDLSFYKYLNVYKEGEDREFDIYNEDSSLGDVYIEVEKTVTSDPEFDIRYYVNYRDSYLSVHMESDEIKRHDSGDYLGRRSGRVLPNVECFVSVEDKKITQRIDTEEDGNIELKTSLESDEIKTYSEGYGYGRRSGRLNTHENSKNSIDIENEDV